MNVKKIAAMAIATLAMAVSATGFAQISKSDLNIGGIYCDQPYSEIINQRYSDRLIVHKNGGEFSFLK